MNPARLISYFFHPINFSIVGAFLFFLFVPKYIYKPQEYLILSVIFIVTYLSPLVLLFFMKKFQLIKSYHMVSLDERKFPTLLFISISFFISYWLFKTTLVDILSLFYLGYGISLIIIYALLYFSQKVSLHMAAVGGLLGFLISFSLYYKINMVLLLAVFFLASGLIGTARIHMEAHTLKEVLIGFFIGLLSQFLVFFIYNM